MGEVMSNIDSIFRIVVNLSLVGSYVIFLVLLVRLAFCKAPRWCSYVLWAIVFVRLICPVFPEGQFSLIPEKLWIQIEDTGAADLNYKTVQGVAETQPGQMLLTQQVLSDQLEIQPDIKAETAGQAVQSGSSEGGSNTAWQSGESLQQSNSLQSKAPRFINVLSIVWIVGMFLLAGYHIISYWRFKIRVKGAVCTEPGVYEVEGEHLSFVLGIFKPAIYLSAGLDEESRRVVLCHERVHLQRRDYVTKPLALGICCIHWFNPLVWAAFHLMNRDCEMSCDEKVVSLLGEESKKIYSYALLDEATKGEGKNYRRDSLCAVLSFGEDSVKMRIRHVLKYKKASVWIVTCAVVVLVVLVVGLCRNPAKAPASDAKTDQEIWDAWVEGGQSMVPWAEDAYVKNGEIVCVFPDNQVTFDVAAQAFGGEAQKKYAFYYEEPYFKPYAGQELSREEMVSRYSNAAELLEGLEQLFPDGQYQYIVRENGLVHVNVAYQKSSYENTIHFWNVTYNHDTENGKNELVVLEQSDGCYKLSIINEGEESFVERVAKEYGWQAADSMAASRMTPEAALDTYAFAYQSRNGNTLYQLAFDKENFKKWDKVIIHEDGYGFGDSSPWVSHYSIDYLAGSEEATIRLYLTNSIPEIYIAEEKVKVVKDGALYCVDHVSYVEYSSLDTRDEVKQIYDLDAATRFYNPFNFQSTGFAQGHTKTIFNHLLNNTNPGYYSVYTDPVTAAKAYLHLGEGSGEVTEVKFAVAPWNLISSALGEGSIVNVRYTFAKDGSSIDIPMTLAEESMNVWALCFTTDSDIKEKTTEKIGGATHENTNVLWASNARIVYSTCTPNGDGYPVYQVSSYGLYKLDTNGLTCIYPGYMPVSTQLAYFDGKLYFPTDSQYYEGALDWMEDSMCVLDVETGVASYIPLTEFEAPWESEVKLSTEEKNEQGFGNRQLILGNPNTIFELGKNLSGIVASDKMEVFIDLDGDGVTEEICMEITEGTGSTYGSWDYYKLSAGEGFEYRTGMNQAGAIWAFTLDGERIYIALYEDGPSGDPLTTVFKFEDNRLREAGSFDKDIRNCTLENGVISTDTGSWLIQTDRIYVQYIFNEKGDLEQIPQETYKYLLAESQDFTQPKLLKKISLHVSPESEEVFDMQPQTVRFLELHHSNHWVLVEGEDGQKGWMHIDYGKVVELGMWINEVFEGLNMAG